MFTLDEYIAECKRKWPRVDYRQFEIAWMFNQCESYLKRGLFDEASNMAASLLNRLSDDSVYVDVSTRQDILHVSHTALGMLSLRECNYSEAARELMHSIEILPSPVLASFGPEMDLAARLLEVGMELVVIKYLEKCQKVWVLGESVVAQWIALIQQGKSPDFSRRT